MKKHWSIAANAILRDNLENTEYLAHNVEELKKLESASKRDTEVGNQCISENQTTKTEEKKDFKIIRIREERQVQEEFQHRMRQAFTYGLKLDANHMPEKMKLLENINRTINNCE